MSTMNDTLKQEEALFIPSEDATATPKEEYVPMVEGEYLGHITDTRTITREFTKDGKQMKARIFNFKVHVAEDNRHNTYTIHSKHGGEPKKVTGGYLTYWYYSSDVLSQYVIFNDNDRVYGWTE